MRLLNIGTLLAFVAAATASTAIQAPAGSHVADIAPGSSVQPHIRPIDMAAQVQNVQRAEINSPADVSTNDIFANNRNRDIAYQAAPNVAPKQTTDKPQSRPEEQCVMVPCSEQECIKNMTPQELAEFRAQCEMMKREEIQKVGVAGKSRVSAGGVDMTYYQMYTPQEAAQKGIHIDGKTAFLTTMNPNGQAVGNRPAGKNLCCCCCCPCCCCCCPCCCCHCCCCKCCCCCCPCCCGCCGGG